MKPVKSKVMAPEIVLLQHYPELHGNVGEGGWVTLHTQSFNGQRSSIAALNYLHRLGFNFDIQTNDQKTLEDVSINDAPVKIEYNVKGNMETLPPNGICCWRLASHVGEIPPTPVSGIVDFKTAPAGKGWAIHSKGFRPNDQEELYKAILEPVNGPHYANDKYKREIKPGVFVDVYDVIDCFEVTSGALQHAVKKLLAAGKRGHKDYEQDLIDILSSVERALFQHQEKHK